MDLWIRSQSRETLIKAGKIFAEDEEVYAKVDNEFGERIGVYKTKERALEVLDEIQNILKPQKIIKTIDFYFRKTLRVKILWCFSIFFCCDS